MRSPRASLAWVAILLAAACDHSATKPDLPHPPSDAFIDVAVGFSHTCGLLGNGKAFCWGRNVQYQLGTGEVTFHDSVPTAVVGDLRFIALDAGAAHTCGVAIDGRAFCWGNNSEGQLGTNLSDPPLAPTPVSVDRLFSSVSAGAYDTCALTQEGGPYCWGQGVGFGKAGTMILPTPVSGGPSFATISAGDYQACGLTASGVGYCWGTNQFGGLGNDAVTGYSDTPVPVMGNLTFQAIGAGNAHACGLTTAGVVYCWGLNNTGQLGDNSTTSRSQPVQIYGGRTFKSLTVGSGHNCAVTQSDETFCWGNNSFGQLGTDITLGSCDGFGACSLVPVPSAVGQTFRSISPGAYHTCGIDFTYRLFCWGMNRDGQIGVGILSDMVPQPALVTVPVP